MATNRTPRVSLSDVAREAGVSKMTVSLALRENGRLQPATAKRIRAVAQRMGYMPNPKLSQVMAETARTRHGAQSGTLAFLTTEPSDGWDPSADVPPAPSARAPSSALSAPPPGAARRPAVAARSSSSSRPPAGSSAAGVPPAPSPPSAAADAAAPREPVTDTSAIRVEDEKSFRAAVERAGMYGYRMERFCITEPGLSAPRFNRVLWSRGIEGLIIPNISGRLYALGQRTLPIEWEKFSVVEIGGSMLQPDVNRVRHDHFGALVKAIHRLEQLNYRRIGLCVTSEVDLRTHHRWSAAYLLWRTLRPAAASLKPLLLEELDPKRVVAWARKHRLDAVLSPGGQFLEVLRTGGLAVPEEIGFASLHIFGPGAERMTGIDQDPRALARSAVDMLVTLMHRRERGVPEHPVEMLSMGNWQDGQTVRPQPESAELPDPDNQVLSF